MNSRVRWSEVTALFGGTFDPPHVGHRQAVRGLFDAPGIRRVIVIPSATPPHKTEFTPFVHRAAMARLCFGPEITPEISIDLREAVRAEKQSAPTYTYDTLLELRSEIPNLAFVIGTDQLASLDRWHRFPDVLSLAHWIVLERKPGHGEDGSAASARKVVRDLEMGGLLRPIPGAGWPAWAIGRDLTNLIIVPTEAPAVSSSAIREELARSGEPPAGTLPPEVWDYLKRNALYGTRPVHT